METGSTKVAASWFVRRRGEVKGPFETAQVARFLAAGKLKASDYLSLDKRDWRHPADWPAFARQVDLLVRQRDETRTRAVVSEDPERDQARRRLAGERRRRRASAPDISSEVAPRLRNRRGVSLAPTLIGALVLAMAIVAWWLSRGIEPEGPASATTDCRALPAPGVDWSYCRAAGRDLRDADLSDARLRNAVLEGAILSTATLARVDLSYADLAGADLSGADLEAAVLKGASLREARLAGAALTEADLRYANLTGADLEGASLAGADLSQATWIDGRVCADGSIGACLGSP